MTIFRGKSLRPSAQTLTASVRRARARGSLVVSAVALSALVLAACGAPSGQGEQGTSDASASAGASELLGQAPGGEVNQTDFSLTVYSGELGPDGGSFVLDTSAAACAAIGNPPGCGQYASNSSPSFGCCDDDGGQTITLGGNHESAAQAIMKTLEDAFGEDNLLWQKSGNKTLQRIVCGNLYPWNDSPPAPSIGALTCIGSMSGDGENPWMIGGPVGDTRYGWQRSGGFMWEDFYVPVAFHNRSTVYFNKTGSGGGTSRSNEFILQVNQGPGSLRVVGLDYTQTEYSITNKQPWNGITVVDQPGAQLMVTINAGRHASSGPAGYFVAETGGIMMPTATNTDSQPTNLNFASCGTLTATFSDGSSSSDAFCIGQGHTENPTAYVEVGEAGNNWWVGGPKWTRDYCLVSGSGPLAISPARDIGESTTRNQTLYVMPASNAGTWANPAAGGEPTSLC